MSEPYESQLQRAKQVDEIGEDFDICTACQGTGRQQPTKLMLAAYKLVFGKEAEGDWPCRECHGEKFVERKPEFECYEDTDFGWN